MGLYRWMRRRRCTCCCVCKYVALFIIISISIAIFKVYKTFSCDDRESKNLVKDLCHLYHAGRIAGSMCHTLCEEQKLVYEQCGNYRGGKKVLYMDCMDCELGLNTRVVLKTKDELAKREFMYLPKGQNGELNQQWQKAAHEILRSNVKYNFAIDLSHIEDIFSYLWGENVGKYAKSTRFPKVQNITIAQTVYALTRQLEYTFYLLHKDKSFVPKIYGTCGPAYLLEYTPAISEYESGLPSLSWLFTQNFRDRAKIAIELLKLLKTIDNDLHQPLHLCDVKGDNFGIRDNGEITLIDTDCATFQDTLFETFFSDNCSSHHDCDFFDCHGYCDTLKGKCRQIRTNNNLQKICEDIFLAGFSRFKFGLLRDPPLSIQLRLNKALHECAYPGPKYDGDYVRVPAPDELWDEIVNILKEYLYPKNSPVIQYRS